MAVLSKPAPSVKVASTSKKKHKTSFLDLPQELRDHVYSFLPLQVEFRIDMQFAPQYEATATAMCLEQTCRAIRKDMESAFWARAKFDWYVDRDERSGGLRCPWASQLLARAGDLELTVAGPPWVGEWGDDFVIHLLKKDEAWLAPLLPFHGRAKCWEEISAEINNDEEVRVELAKDREMEDIAAKQEFVGQTQPFLDLAGGELERKNCITLDVLRIIVEMREHLAKNSWR